MTRPLTLFALLFAGALLCTTGAAQNQRPLPFDPEHQQPVMLSTPELTAEVMAYPPNRATGQARSIRVKTPGGESLVPLPFQFYQVNAILQGPPGRLVVVGMSGGYVYEIGILDVAAARVIDRFTCYSPAVSPNGRYVAFTKFYAPHFLPSPEDHSMLYLAAGSPSENRPEGIPLDNDVDVGFAIYPPGVGNWKADNMNVPPGSAHTVAGSYVWKDSSEYFFADGTASDFAAVWVSIGDSAAKVGRLDLGSQFRGQETHYFPPRLSSATVSDNTLRLHISTNVSRTVSVSLADFVSVGSVSLTGHPAGGPDKRSLSGIR